MFEVLTFELEALLDVSKRQGCTRNTTPNTEIFGVFLSLMNSQTLVETGGEGTFGLVIARSSVFKEPGGYEVLPFHCSDGNSSFQAGVADVENRQDRTLFASSLLSREGERRFWLSLYTPILVNDGDFSRILVHHLEQAGSSEEDSKMRGDRKRSYDEFRLQFA
ncbi:hypothetical protein AAE478_009506 [Parahypoxylon ruwenzoriense]